MIDFITSDHHFGHKNILQYDSRPWSTIEEHDRALIERHNSIVAKDDFVLFLGDFSFHKPEKTLEIANALHGRKILVVGNHDRSASRMSALGFDLTMERCRLTLAGKSCICTHIPVKLEKGFVNIHGHTHATDPSRTSGKICVSVTAWDYFPVGRTVLESMLNFQ